MAIVINRNTARLSERRCFATQTGWIYEWMCERSVTKRCCYVSACFFKWVYANPWSSFWYLWQCGQVPSPAGKWNQHLHKAWQQKEAWSALKCPGRWLLWLLTSENTVAQHQQITWQPKSTLTVETSHWTSSYMDSVPLHSSSRLWDLDFQIKCKMYFHLKRGLWTSKKQSSYFLFSPGKMLLMMFLFQNWLGSPFPEDVWAWWLLMHWLQLQFTPCEALTGVWIGVAWQYPQACSHLLLVHIFLPNLFLPVNFEFNMLWYSTPWTAPPFQ